MQTAPPDVIGVDYATTMRDCYRKLSGNILRKYYTKNDNSMDNYLNRDDWIIELGIRNMYKKLNRKGPKPFHLSNWPTMQVDHRYGICGGLYQ
jgi:hypothetical protein